MQFEQEQDKHYSHTVTRTQLPSPPWVRYLVRGAVAMSSLTVFLAAAAIGTIVSGSALAQLSAPSPTECSFSEASDFHVVQALKRNGVTDAQFEALADAGEIGRTVSQACIAELRYAAENPDIECQKANGVAFS